ncbi:MAG: GNAT family N-acetyltransferase [Sphingobacteriaceae bacterium]|nr:GNAT family N-acetyltransferase [Sphingobacteriaceae bacterium]
MLTIKQYGVTLTRITSNDIELLRYWRNQQSVKMYMDYRENITPEMQQKWFKSINNKFNYYFIIEFEGKQVGLINAKNFSYENGFGEGGIFIWDAAYINSFAAVFSTLALLNFVFHKVKLCETSHARILKDNDRAIHYNQLIGYKLASGQENEYNQLYVLTLEDYLKNGAKLNKAAEMLNNGNGELTFSGTVSENNLDEINKLLKN